MSNLPFQTGRAGKTLHPGCGVISCAIIKASSSRPCLSPSPLAAEAERPRTTRLRCSVRSRSGDAASHVFPLPYKLLMLFYTPNEGR